MPISYSGTTAKFSGVCAIEEAAELTEWLLARAGRKVDLGACTSLHTALLQVLLALEPPLRAHPRAPVLARWLAPHLPAAAAPSSSRQSASRKSASRKAASPTGEKVFA